MTLLNQRSFAGIGLGTAPLAFKEVSEQQGISVIHAALDAGVMLMDTALAYSRPGFASYAESLLRAAMRGRSERPLIATKGGHWREGTEFPVDGTPATLRRHCEQSLHSLGVERIDLYQLHHVDSNVPLEESIGALSELQQEGKVDMIGLSNVSASQIDLATGLAEISAVQNRASFVHSEGLEIAQHCAGLNIAYLAYMPLDGPRRSAGDCGDSRAAIAEERGVSPQQVSLAWLMSRGDHIIPLVGATRSETIEDSAAAIRLQWSTEELARLDVDSKAYADENIRNASSAAR